MGENVTLITAFGAGFLSFISPCVLPLIPGYLSFVSGVSLEEMQDDAALAARRQVVVKSLAFVLGFSLVFIALGASASAVGKFLFRQLQHSRQDCRRARDRLRSPHHGRLPDSVPRDRETDAARDAKPKSLVGAVLVGMAFGFGWTPCIGPILAGILLLAGSKDTVLEGVVMLAVYSLGLGIPFLLTALAINKFFAAIGTDPASLSRDRAGVRRAARLESDVLLFTDQMTVIVRYLTPYLPVF